MFSYILTAILLNSDNEIVYLDLYKTEKECIEARDIIRNVMVGNELRWNCEKVVSSIPINNNETD